MILTVVCDVLGDENNGTTLAAMNLIRSMRERGHTVRIVCGDEDKRGQKDYFIMPNLKLVKPLEGYLAKNGVSLARVDKKTLARALEGADAVHIMMPFMLGRAAVRMAARMGLPVTAGFHCQAENFSSHIFMMNVNAVNRVVYKDFYRGFYRYVDCVHYPTEFIRNVFESVIGERLPCRVISNGVSDMFKPRREEKPEELKGRRVILFTGRYSREKSHRLLIEAALKSKHSRDIQLIFAGCGPLEDKLRALSEELPNEPIFGFHDRAELLRIINYSDLYVHPAEIEIEAIACLEAISCGLVPVINKSPRSATKYFARDERNLFEFNDTDDLARKIDYWLDHPEEKRKCAESYIGFARHFDFQYCMNEMERMILDTAEAKSHASLKARAASEASIMPENGLGEAAEAQYASTVERDV